MNNAFIIKSFLLCYDNLAYIIAVLAIVATIVASSGILQYEKANTEAGEGKKPKKKSVVSAWIIIVLVFIMISAIIWAVCGYFHKTWTVVPDLEGRSYDNSIDVLYESGLKGQPVLAGTNDDLSESDSRVAWQYPEKDSVVRVGTFISFLIDDQFALNSMPLTHYKFKDAPTEQSKVLDYNIRYKKLSENKSFDDPHWDIEIDAKDINYEIKSFSWHGHIFTDAGTVISYREYAESMALTLTDIIENSSEAYVNSTFKSELGSCRIVGKLIPTFEQSETGLAEMTTSDDKVVLYLPQMLTPGKYLFAFSIIDSDDQLIEWYHYITIVEEN